MSFHIFAGKEIRTIRELAEEFHHLSGQQFDHHVSRGKNDFAQWIADAFGEVDLAARLRKAGSRREMSRILDETHGQQHTTVEPTIGITDDEFAKRKDEYAGRNDALLDRFDEMASRIEQALSKEMPEEIVKLRDALNEKYAELRQKTSELRREGKDTLIVSLMLRQVPSKIQLAVASADPKDFEFVRVLFSQIDAELKEVAASRVLDVRKEVEALAGATKDYKEEEKGKV